MSAAGPRRARPLLRVRGVETFYGKIQALKGIDIDVNEGEIVTLIGANGAGKSTTMMTIFGVPARQAGSSSTGATSRTCRRTRSRDCRSPSRPKDGASFRA